MIKKTPYEDPQYIQFNKLLIQLELSQAALNDLKAINEGIKLKNITFQLGNYLKNGNLILKLIMLVLL